MDGSYGDKHRERYCMAQPRHWQSFFGAILVCWVMSARCTNYIKSTRVSNCAVMKKAAFFGAILGCLVMFACGAGLCCFLLMTYWLAPAQASFQRELFFDYTQTEAVATAQLCPAVSTQVQMELPTWYCHVAPTHLMPGPLLCMHQNALCARGIAAWRSVGQRECAGGGQGVEARAAG